VAQFVMLRLGHPDPSKVFLIAGALSLAMGAVLVRMWPDLWGQALDWTRLHRRATL
jgi:hypothetical protein